MLVVLPLGGWAIFIPLRLLRRSDRRRKMERRQHREMLAAMYRGSVVTFQSPRHPAGARIDLLLARRPVLMHAVAEGDQDQERVEEGHREAMPGGYRSGESRDEQGED
jgi:hypothetical protein